MKLSGNCEQLVDRWLKNGVHHDCEAPHSFHRSFQRLALLRDAGFQPGYVMDIGASDGQWSRRALKLFPWAEFFCIEPLAEFHPALARCSEEYSHIHHWEGCLGPEPAKVALDANRNGCARFCGNASNPYGKPSDVCVETLDRLIEQGICRQPDLLRLSARGFELEVLNGGSKALEQVEVIVTEVSFFPFQADIPIFHEVVGYMAERGFIVADILGMTMRPLDGATGQADVLFVKHDHPLRCSNQWDSNSTY